MNSSQSLPTEQAKAEGSGRANSLTLSGLFLLDLSTALQRAMEIGLLEPEIVDNKSLKLHISMCREHQMVNLPNCPMCPSGGCE